jgi:two-component system, LytTR family, response regulator
MKTRCMLIDDEPLAIQLLQKHLSQLETFEVVATAQNAIKGLELLQKKEVDLLFCDIKMPQISGLDFLKMFKNPPKTIITTAHREFALESYDLDIVDYLLKPITFERFFKAIEKYIRLKQPILLPQSSPPTYWYVKVGHKTYQVNPEDIWYIESQKDYVKIVFKDRVLTAKLKISDLESQLAAKGFLRIHRSFMVNLQYVTAFSATELEVAQYHIPVGTSYRALVLKYCVS